jgi:cytochrome c peroxidase
MIRTIYLLLILAFFVSSFSILSGDLFPVPKSWPKPLYNFDNNPLDAEKVSLGRKLFYDPVLSLDSTISCSSCHSNFNAFAHTDHDLSHGIGDSIGFRNAPPLFNLAWQNTFMWDGAINHLDMQALAPISHPGEMGEKIENIVKKLAAQDKYVVQFQKAFGDTLINGERILKALSQFQLTLLSYQSKYDSVKSELTFFSEQESKGYVLFLKHCNECHREPLFSTFEFADNGLPVDSTLNDFGRVRITQNKKDSFHFKIPTLRNLYYTFPYMHDGRFKKLSQVVNHYVKGIEKRSTLAKELYNPIKLSSNDKADLIAFLLTLSDPKFVFNKDFGFPSEK